MRIWSLLVVFQYAPHGIENPWFGTVDHLIGVHFLHHFNEIISFLIFSIAVFKRIEAVLKAGPL